MENVLVYVLLKICSKIWYQYNSQHYLRESKETLQKQFPNVGYIDCNINYNKEFLWHSLNLIQLDYFFIR